MDAGGRELQAGSWVPVLVEQVVNDTLLVTLSHGERSFTGLLLDCSKKSGLFCIPPSLSPKQDEPPSDSCTNGPFDNEVQVEPASEVESQSERCAVMSKENNNGLVPSLLLSPGSIPPCPPYFEGAPFPPPLWLRHSYNQWVPQPPPRTIKRTKRRLSRNRDSGRLIMSTIRLRPRQVLCEKCKNTLDPNEDGKDGQAGRTVGKLNILNKVKKRHDESDYEEHRNKREKKEEKYPGELVHRSPVIKISYSTPQGKGEVVKIPSRVHGSVEPFCPKRILLNRDGNQEKNRDSDKCQETNGFVEKSSNRKFASIPKLKLTRPVLASVDVPPPKIRLKPHRMNDGENVSIYKAELIDGMNSLQSPRKSNSGAFYTVEPTRRSFPEMCSGSSGDEDDFKVFPHSKNGHDDLTLVMNYHTRKADSSNISVCSNDSLDESKSSSSELASLEICDFLPGEEISVSSSSKDERKTVPPLTVKLHTKNVSKCITDEGRTVSVGDVVWGKIHGSPWWPAQVLSISISQKENGEPAWQEAKIAWFGSPTTSFLSVTKLSPFCDFFKLRFNRKKKGLYRKAIAEAARAAEHLTPEIKELLTQCET
nr:PWWP domain-containing protein 2B isoform X2 [Geotrypetes seraphini]XP_033798881.1 PWWP domain-containing protein 2B isoform X2 [Geotrypetes seraphini]XP_033798883.1 PWWP domain-containing protein 2B isoform X2 [Geotrypetes seraphini]